MPEDLFGVMIHQEREEAGGRSAIFVLYKDVGDVTTPDLIGGIGDEVVGEIGVGAVGVTRVGGPRGGTLTTLAEREVMLAKYGLKPISTNGIEGPIRTHILVPKGGAREARVIPSGFVRKENDDEFDCHLALLHVSLLLLVIGLGRVP